MTTGQTFYTILSVFYLINMVRATKPGSIIIQNKLFKGWKLSHPSILLGGIQKCLVITHLLPLHSYTIFSAQGGQATVVKKQFITRPKNVKKLISKISHTASCVRSFSFITFYLYFIVIPIAYINFGDTWRTYIIILVALIMPSVTAILFVCKHRRIAPSQKDIRWKNFLYCILMPWHAMRVVDFIFLTPHLEKIHPLSYATLCSNAEARDYLSQEYRNSLYLTDSKYSKQDFEKLFHLNDIDPAPYLKPPVPEGSGETQYCPCCHILFTDQAKQCSECKDLELIRVKQ